MAFCEAAAARWIEKTGRENDEKKDFVSKRQKSAEIEGKIGEIVATGVSITSGVDTNLARVPQFAARDKAELFVYFP